MHIEIIIPRRRRTADTTGRQELDALYEDFLGRAWAALKSLGVATQDGEWREDLHPRAPDGRFGNKAGEKVSHHGLQPAPKPGPADLKEKSAKGRLYELLASGHEWSKKELMEIAGITNEKTFTSWLSMFKKPELSGGRKALQIVKTKDGLYRVALPDGTPAPPKPTPPRVEMPIPTPAPTPAPAPKREPSPHTAALLKTSEWWSKASVWERRQFLEDHDLPKVTGPEGHKIDAPYAAWANLTPAEQDKIAQAYTNAMAVPDRPALPKAWKPAKNGKEATQRAVAEGWVTHADFNGVRAEDANAIMGSMAEHLSEFPKLRDQAQHWYVGTNSGWKDAYVEIASKPLRERLQAQGKTPEEIERSLKYWVRPPKISGKAWATAWDTRQAQTRAVAFSKTNLTTAGAADMERALKRSVESRWHPPGCDTVKSIMDHELGHQMDYMLDLRRNAEVQALHSEARRVSNPSGKPLDNISAAHASKQAMTANVSTYAATNIAEFIAEAWAEAKNNPEPRPIAQRLAKIVRSEYAKRYPEA